MRTLRQIAVLILAAAIFICFDLSIYFLITRRCESDVSLEMRRQGIELSSYLPFDEDSRAVTVDSSIRMTDDLPVLDGAAALYPVFSAVAGSLYPEGCCEFDGERFAPGSALQFRNTLRAYKAVADGDADVIFCAAPSEAQLDYAKSVGAELVLVPIGYEAFVFIVNENNPVDDLTVDEIRGIYTGEITNWAEVGGADRMIDPKTRLEGSGSQTVMEAFMHGEEMRPRPFGFLGASIGYSFRYYVEEVPREDSVKILSVGGVSPTRDNIRDGSYPIVCSFYAVYRSDNKNPNVPILIDWLLSPEGQRLIESNGYVSVGDTEDGIS